MMGSIEAFHSQIWSALSPLDDSDFEAIAARSPTDDEVEAVKALVGAPLPVEFVAFSGRSNGLLVVARDEAWPEPEEGSVCAAWTLWRGVVLLGFDTEDLPRWASIATAAEQLHDFGIEGIAPVFKVLGDAGRIWGVNRQGESVLVTDGEVEVLAATIPALYAMEIEDLVARHEKMRGLGR